MSDLLSLVYTHPKSNLERNLSIFKEYKKGKKTMDELAEKHSISKARISQIIQSVEVKVLKGQLKWPQDK